MTGAINVDGAFSYAGLASGITGDLKRAARRIRELVGEQHRSVIEAGRIFLDIKTKLDHGQFLAWAEAACAMSARTLQRYMQVAEMAQKYDTVSYFEPSALYLLAAPSTPGGVRQEIFARAARGEVIRPNEIKSSIRLAREKDPLSRPRTPPMAAPLAPVIPDESISGEQAPKVVVEEPVPATEVSEDQDEFAPGLVALEDAWRIASRAARAQFLGDIGVEIVRQKSRPARWAEAVATLEELQQEYEQWHDGLPENLTGGALAEKLQAVADIDLSSVQEADLPLGFGRD